MKISNRYFYILSGIGHISYSLVTLNNKKLNKNIIFIISHILISLSLILRIADKNIGNIYISILASIGHFLLLIYTILKLITKNYSINKKIFIFIWIFGQIGMIIYNYLQYIEYNMNINESHKLMISINKIISYTLLLIFNIYGLLTSKNISMIIIHIIFVFAFIIESINEIIYLLK